MKHYKQCESSYEVPRSCRFTLDSKGFGLTPWVQKVRYSLRPKRLDVRWIEVVMPDGSNPILNYISTMLVPCNTDTMLLQYFDQEGKILGKVKFNHCRLLDHFVEFDYENQTIVSHRLIFDFENHVFKK
jgi:hypothetical protein